MKIGLIDVIFADSTFEEIMEKAASLGYEHLELSAWPKLTTEEIDKIKAQYPNTPPALLNYFTGITHLDIEELSDEKIAYVKEYEKKTGVEISALCYYGNPMDPDLTLRAKYQEHLKQMVKACARLGVPDIHTFIGRDPKLNNEENVDLAVEFWMPVIKIAEEYKIRIGIENCPMFFTAEQWPNGLNMFVSPAIWKQLFDRIPSDYFGLVYDPSHSGWQQIDLYKPIKMFADKLFAVHIKDAKVLRDELDLVGITAYPLQFYRPVLPGFGDTDWGKFFGELNDIGYNGDVYVEIEDEAYADSPETALKIAMNKIRQYVPK